MLCEICGATTVKAFSLGNHPLCDDLKKIGSGTLQSYYPINIQYCTQCRTAYNETQVDPTILFPQDYHYRPRFTQDVLDGMKNLLSSLNNLCPLSGKKILDIGCNDGSLLNIARKVYQADTYGIEPTAAALEATENGHTILHSFFNSVVAESFLSLYGPPDVIIFTNVFAHISNLPELLGALKLLLKNDSIVVIENHYLASVVEKNQFDTFYHEHPRTYSLTSFQYIAQLLNMSILDVNFPGRYGGNIRVTLTNSISESQHISPHVLERERVCDDILNMQVKIAKWVKSKSELISHYVNLFGPLPSKAFPGRSAIAYQMLGLTTDHISACFERVGSLKIGHYIPGTNIPILPETEVYSYLSSLQVPIINSAWHISDEIRHYISTVLSLDNPVIDIIEPDDFL